MAARRWTEQHRLRPVLGFVTCQIETMRRLVFFGIAVLVSGRAVIAQQSSIIPARFDSSSSAGPSAFQNSESMSIARASVDSQRNSAAIQQSSANNERTAESIREAIKPQLDEVIQQREVPRLAPAIASEGSVANSTPPQAVNRPKNLSYLPTLKPIGEIDIGIQAKPKANDNSVPPLFNDPSANVPIRDTTYAFNEAAMLGVSSKVEYVPYQPLYFEEVNLERYGRTCRIQPAVSMVRFFGTVPLMPYFMTIHNPNRPMYWHWPHEAGWGAPRVRELPPFSWKAASVQALAITGAAAVIP